MTANDNSKSTEPRHVTLDAMLSGTDFPDGITADIQHQIDLLAESRMRGRDTYARYLIFEPLDGLVTPSLLAGSINRLLEYMSLADSEVTGRYPEEIADLFLERAYTWLAFLSDAKAADYCARVAARRLGVGSIWHRAWLEFAQICRRDAAAAHPESIARYRGSRVDDAYASRNQRLLKELARKFADQI